MIIIIICLANVVFKERRKQKNERFFFNSHFLLIINGAMQVVLVHSDLIVVYHIFHAAISGMENVHTTHRNTQHFYILYNTNRLLFVDIWARKREREMESKRSVIAHYWCVSVCRFVWCVHRGCVWWRFFGMGHKNVNTRKAIGE